VNMKLEALRKDELTAERQKCLERIAGNADKISKLDHRLAIIKGNEMEEKLIAAELAHGIQKTPALGTI